MTSIQLTQEIKGEFPEFNLVQKKDSFFMKLLFVLLLVVTFGAQKDFMSSYTTTVGYTIYVPTSWGELTENDRVITLRHERVHLRQLKKYGKFLFCFLYLLPFFPVGLAYWRARFEWEAYEETLRAIYEIHGEASLLDIKRRDSIVSHFTTGNYGWMWPFKATVQGWYASAVEKIRRGA